MLKVNNLKKTYDGLNVIDDISFELAENEVTAVIGPSGCGKSTMLNIISGLETDYQGVVTRTNHKLGYVFQEDRLLSWMTVYQNIRCVHKKGDETEIQTYIDAVGLKGFENYYPDHLSGGMRQRCAIVRAFYYGGKLLLMDEPFKSLDYNLRLEMLDVLKSVRKVQESSILFVTHDIDEALTIADRILVLSKRPAAIVKEIKLAGKDDTDLFHCKKEIIQWIRY